MKARLVCDLRAGRKHVGPLLLEEPRTVTNKKNAYLLGLSIG
jgi:hypothetical protein